MVKMKASAGAVNASHNGHDYPVDEDGNVEVPAEACEEMLSHGMTHIKREEVAPKGAIVGKGGKGGKGVATTTDSDPDPKS